MEKITVPRIIKKKKAREKITSLTCYDWFTGRLIDEAGIDIALVGDSLANTRLGYPNTLPVTVEEMVHHVAANAQGVKRALLVADMPFQSYEFAPWQAAKTAGRFIKEGGASAVKVEGGVRVAESIKAILNSNIPVMGHLGLTPQSFHIKGGYPVAGKTPKEAASLVKEAKLIEKLGVFAIVLEGISSKLARKITSSVNVPTIGIGAGPDCDGQVLVLDDILGLTEGKLPRFVKKYANLRGEMLKAVSNFKSDVLHKRFPAKEHTY